MTAYAALALLLIVGASLAIDTPVDTPQGFRVTPLEPDARTVLLERKLIYFLSLIAIGALVLVIASRRRIGDAALDTAAKGLHATRRMRRGVRSVAKEVDRRSRS